jgi:N-methylhydantoinase A/acetophenone carboxylase
MTQELTTDYEAFNATVRAMIDQAKADLASEGLPVDSAVFSVELDMLYGGQVHVKRVSSPRIYLESEADAQAVYDAFESEFSAAFSPHVVNKPGGAFIDNIIVKATVPQQKLELPTFPLGGPDPSAARTGSRQAYWPDHGGYADTAVFAFDGLTPGNQVDGPAIVEAEFTTIVLPPGQRLSINSHGLGLLESRAGSAESDRPRTLEGARA